MPGQGGCDMHSNRYTILFALLVCVTCSVVLALTAGGLKPVIQRNEAVDIRRNILRALDIHDGRKRIEIEELNDLYDRHVREFFVDQQGRILDETSTDLPGETPDSDVFPVFARVDNSAVTGYGIPISGAGLWSTLYGYIAIESDGETVMGITFYSHGETPGLGGEVDSRWFTENFIGKKIFDNDGVLRSITVAKGAIPLDTPERQRRHMVDGISGATMTGNGINDFLKRDLQRYEPFLHTVRRGETPHIPGV
jgi:Na+-transporting NADH:ubiquinone oxidoreductase subunit C